MKMLNRLRTLLVITFIMAAAVIATVWLGLGRKSREQGHLSPEYLAKRDLVAPLQRVRGSRPFTPQEMQILRQFARDPDRFIRCRALSALSYVRDPQQRKEAIFIALERLKDEEWVVRVYALRALGLLGATDAVPHILPLLNDPQPEVREEAKKTLQMLGYKVN